MKSGFAILLTILLAISVTLTPLTFIVPVLSNTPPTIPTIYLDPSEYIFYSNETNVGQLFNVSVWIRDTPSGDINVGGVQVHLEFNDTLINCTRWIVPSSDSSFFMPSPYTALPEPPNPGYVHVSPDLGYVEVAVSKGGLPPTAPWGHDGIICIFEFEIKALPPRDGEVSCPLHINNTNTFVINQESSEIETNKEDGSYKFVYVPPPPPVGHIWLEASPPTYEAIVPKPFNVTIRVENVSETDYLLGIQFEISYDEKKLKVTSYFNGSFFDPWAIHGTFWAFVDEPGRLVYGQMILPNSEGEFDLTAWPSGGGEVAIITFLPLVHEALSFNITPSSLFDEYFINKNGEYITYAPPKPCEYTYAPLAKPTLSVNPSSLISSYLGEHLQLNISISDLDAQWKLTYIEFKLQYNNTFLEALEATEGPFMRQFGTTTFSSEKGTGYIKANISLAPQTVFPSGSGTVATIVLNVTSRPPAFSDLTLLDTRMLDPDGYIVLHNLNNGAYTMHERLVHEIMIDSEIFHIVTVSNASISPVPIIFDLDHRLLNFNVTGWGTPAFIEVTIPNVLLWADNKWLLIVGPYKIVPSVTSINSTHTLLSFTYNFTEEPVYIIGVGAIPEIPSAIIMLLLFAALIPTSLVHLRRKRPYISK
jgi:hypothetical protein